MYFVRQNVECIVYDENKGRAIHLPEVHIQKGDKEMKRDTKKMLIHWAIIVGLAALIVLILGSCEISQGSEVEEWTCHAVEDGDTLWMIVLKYNPEYEGDIREVVYQIEKENGLSSSAIKAGDLLYVPVME